MATRRKTTKFEIPIPRSSTGGRASTTEGRDMPGGSAFATLVPTVMETLLFAIYPLTLLLGSLYSTVHPALRTVPYLPDAQSYDPAVAPSYFAKKSNVFNVYFVKVGWLWMTLAFLLLICTHRSHGPPFRPTFTRRRAQALVRYVCVTTAWVAVTQWCFGAPIIDRSFRWTGGQCEAVLRNGGGGVGDAPDERTTAEMGEVLREVVTHAACKAIGGTWKGGHDISGHVFLLILGSAMLMLELLPVLVRDDGYREPRRVRAADGSVVDAATTPTTGEEGEGDVTDADTDAAATIGASGGAASGLGTKFALVVAGLSWWMLLMTSAYFHTWFEKLTGSLVAFAAIYVVYILPRALPGLRSVLGLPGV